MINIWVKLFGKIYFLNKYQDTCLNQGNPLMCKFLNEKSLSEESYL